MADQGLEGNQSVNLEKHPSGIVPTIINVVSTVNLDCKLDLKSIKLQAPTAEYNPQATSSFCEYEDQGTRIKSTNQFFWSDEDCSGGGQKLAHIYCHVLALMERCSRPVIGTLGCFALIRQAASARQAVGILEKLFQFSVCTGAKSESQSKLAASKDFKIQEIVGSCNVKFPIWLERLANSHVSCTSVSTKEAIIFCFTW
ncbi:TATA-binding protein, variant 2 [Lathyrus oleraceus]|uniref:TATA-binding protein, variant 2 n=1 Tax=Pisum sativum TaxID=3888 RepID=A0A9D4WQR5_PEA|nr:TATA-binding protein, variant 2 [Pisum sativum]